MSAERAPENFVILSPLFMVRLSSVFQNFFFFSIFFSLILVKKKKKREENYLSVLRNVWDLFIVDTPSPKYEMIKRNYFESK